MHLRLTSTNFSKNFYTTSGRHRAINRLFAAIHCINTVYNHDINIIIYVIIIILNLILIVITFTRNRRAPDPDKNTRVGTARSTIIMVNVAYCARDVCVHGPQGNDAKALAHAGRSIDKGPCAYMYTEKQLCTLRGSLEGGAGARKQKLPVIGTRGCVCTCI